MTQLAVTTPTVVLSPTEGPTPSAGTTWLAVTTQMAGPSALTGLTSGAFSFPLAAATLLTGPNPESALTTATRSTLARRLHIGSSPDICYYTDTRLRSDTGGYARHRWRRKHDE